MPGTQVGPPGRVDCHTPHFPWARELMHPSYKNCQFPSPQGQAGMCTGKPPNVY